MHKKGTSFNFILTRSISNADAVKGVSSEQYLDFSELISKVACIDDDVQNLFYYEQLFERFNIKSHNFHSMNEFFEGNPKDFDLIITDLNFQEDIATNRIQEFTKALSLNGILLLITAADDLVGLSNSRGFDAVLQKPVQGIKFYRMIGEQLFLKNYNRPVFENVYANYDFEHDKIKKHSNSPCLSGKKCRSN
ncbi:MAG: response regulator [Saprospiraceae bacterium]|nr:response regulator [Saprospiraceae bacterium]